VGRAARCVCHRRDKTHGGWYEKAIPRIAGGFEDQLVTWPSHFEIPAYLGPTFWSKQRLAPQTIEILAAAMERDDHGGIGDSDAPVQPYDRSRTSFEVQRQGQKRVALNNSIEFRLASLCHYFQLAPVNAS